MSHRLVLAGLILLTGIIVVLLVQGPPKEDRDECPAGSTPVTSIVVQADGESYWGLDCH